MPVWKRTEILSLLLATVVLLITVFTALHDSLESGAQLAADRKSRIHLETVNRLVDLVKDAETGQRGYLLTRDQSYLQPYRFAITAIPAEMKRLKQIGEPSPDLDRFIESVTLKLRELTETVDLQDRASFDAALALIKTDRGRQAMESLRDSAQRLTSAQYAKLSGNATRSEQRARRTGLLDVLGSALLLALLALSAFTIHKNTRRREQMILLLNRNQLELSDLTQQAHRAEERIRDILESISDAFVSFDSNFTIVYVNAAAAHILQLPKEELPGKSFWAVLPEELAAGAEARYRQVMESQTPYSFENYLPKSNTWWHESIYPAKDGGLSISLCNVTERKRLDERSRHTQKLESLGVLAGGIAHDFNNLLTAILGGATLLREELQPGTVAAEHLQLVINAGERAALLTRQMLAYSGRGRFVIQQLDLTRQIRDISRLLESSVTSNVELILNLQTEGVFVEADPSQMQQILVNLVTNGAEAIESGYGTVAVSTRLERLDSDYVRDNMAGDNIVPGMFVLLEVHDTGKGMDRQTLGRIFDPFFTTKFTGRGLGLAAVIGIVRGHRGAIKVYSHPGQGTTFKVFFPVAVQQLAAQQASGQSAPAKSVTVAARTLRGTETILVVDDEETVQHLASAALEKYGYRVLQARNGKEALEIFDKYSAAISLVLLDMTMPVMSGEETLWRLKQIRPDIAVIASSGYNEIEALRRFGQGVRAFLQKPYRVTQLVEKIREVLSAVI